jgi:uncharacterized cupin superfamily protein
MGILRASVEALPRSLSFFVTSIIMISSAARITYNRIFSQQYLNDYSVYALVQATQKLQHGNELDKKIIRLSVAPVGFGDTADELEPAMFDSSIPVQHTHSYFEDDELGLYIGVWDTTSMTEVAGPYACDEFMWLLQGEVGIRNNKTGAIETVRAGEAFVIPRGYDCQWQQNGYLRKLFVIYEPPGESQSGLTAADGIVRPQLSTDVDVQSEPNKSVAYRNGDGRFCTDSWQTGAFESEAKSKPYHQFVYIVEGCLRMKDDIGVEHSFEVGEAVFLPQGVVARWNSRDRLGILTVKVQA